jgi:hypothetical protein
MKKSIPLVICILITLTSKSQEPLNRIFPWGTWGIGNINGVNSLDIYEPYHIDGYQIYYNWSDLEQTEGNFDWTNLDEEMRIVVNSNIWVAVQIMVGPNCPQWIYDSVPQVFTTGGNNDGPYPYYFDTFYKARYYNLFKQAAEHFNNLPPLIKSHFMYWQITEGSTGDEDPYKGTPVDSQYEINFYDWQDFRHAAWDSAQAYAGPDRQYRFLFNDGNFAQDLEYVDQRFPHDLHKDGLLSHAYSFEGELLYYSRQYRNLGANPYDNRSRGEVQDIFNKFWWHYAPIKQAFALSCSAASGGLDMLNITPGYINSISNDTRAGDFYDKYSGLRKADHGFDTVGFIALRDVPDFADSFRFPPLIYGPVIDPLKKPAYEQRVHNIWTNEKDSTARKYWLTMRAIVQYLNPARVERIVNEFKPRGAMYSTEDFYHNDFGVNVTKNWERFIRQWYPDLSSIGAWRIGPDSSIYGRYSRLFRIVAGKGAMYFTFNDSLVNRGDRINVTVTYYDTGNGKWAMNCSEQALKVTNTNTHQWLQKTMTVDSFIPNTVYQGQADFALRYQGNDNTPFTLIQLSVLSAQNNVANKKVDREAMDIKVSPNPNKGQFNVSFTAKKSERYSVYVTDESGDLYYKESRAGTAGNNVWNISSSKIGRGSYILHIESPTTTGAAKFIVIK